ncbi:MAG: hypothetical protein KDK30_15465, partial [Leptospiraceae bacterium]|nr:hypothetical protein [Leptospiraceae bacterium]
MAEQDNSSTTASGAEDHYEVDPRKLLALHPRDAEIIFTSQSSYGSSLTADFRENVKALNQVYSAVQRYLQGIYRRPDVFYPQLQDIFKDLQMHKRAISDKIPMPTEEQLQKQCINLAAQNPPFIHVLRELSVSGNNSFTFVSLYVAPTEKHDDKVIVGYRSTIENSMKVLRDRIRRGELGIDYALAFGRVSAASELPVTFGRVDTEMKKIYINEKSFSSITQADLAHLRRVNQEIYKRLYKPLLLQGIKERIFLSISCEDIRKLDFAGSDRVFDIVLFNNAEAIKDRFAALANFLKA